MFSLRQLEVFREVMRLRTTIAAARTLRISQPAVSNAIRQLEGQCGFALFDRQGNRLVPTADAIELYRDGEAIFGLYHALARKIEDRRASAAGRLRIVCTLPIANAIIPAAVTPFLARRPGVLLSVDTGGIDEIMSAVESRTADLGLCLVAPERGGLAVETIASARMVCAFRPGHRLEALDQVTAADLADTPLILYDRRSRLSLLLEERFLSPALRRNEIAAVPFSSMACLLAEAGLGVALVDSFTAVAGGRYRLGTRPLSPAEPVPVRMITRATETPSRVLASFMAELRSTTQAVADG
ncbi:LysR family transcriptional regulator [Paracoccus sp. Z118]|uniref:LysR family transcriptional regulator n=1 Tax=Paracoccus sp. Z118 TaxID=2851017 RepID=UPI001C2C7017|nr:LysR family transcriptional regulator [Paracoccus sp. Z118]MBV0893285.1 LysR family transcriptional regulator [Paracoccus sp. Z118]